MDELTIGEVARQAGIRTSALRYYESVGLLPEPRRLNGRRRYDPSIVQMISIVRLAQQAGFSVAEIQALFYGFAAEPPPDANWRPLVEQKLREVEELIERSRKMQALLKNLLHCGSARFEDCLITEIGVVGAKPIRVS